MFEKHVSDKYVYDKHVSDKLVSDKHPYMVYM